MEFKVKPTRGKPRVLEATPEALQEAMLDVGTSLKWIRLEDGAFRFMQFDADRELDYGDTPLQGPPELHRADAGSVDALGALPAMEAFLGASDEWRELYEWEDVSYELGTRINSLPKLLFVIFMILVIIVVLLETVGL